ncbi:hypothetical protein DFJ73DRAFT_577870 [Zopfochytrium polystomum]|nr:hypothetical protein DFJ73DRAFT_577870 [Zopfochytrium polystomum]
MGGQLSVQAHLSVRDIYKYASYGFSVAEIEYAFRRYQALRALDQFNKDDVDDGKSPKKLANVPHPMGPDKDDAPSFGQPKANGILIDGATGTTIFAQQLQLDWILCRVFLNLFPNGLNSTFQDYLKAINLWKGKTANDRLDFIFKILDYNEDGELTPGDLTIFIQQMTKYQFALGDRVHIRNDPRSGTLRYLGETKFSAGSWAGLELDSESGKHNGTVQGVKYFQCDAMRGVFVPSASIELESHHAQAVEIVEQIAGARGATSVSIETFRTALSSDPYFKHIDRLVFLF